MGTRKAQCRDHVLYLGEEMTYQAHNHPAVVQAMADAHKLMLLYANSDVEGQGDMVRDIVRQIAKLSTVLDYKQGRH